VSRISRNCPSRYPSTSKAPPAACFEHDHALAGAELREAVGFDRVVAHRAAEGAQDDDPRRIADQPLFDLERRFREDVGPVGVPELAHRQDTTLNDGVGARHELLPAHVRERRRGARARGGHGDHRHGQRECKSPGHRNLPRLLRGWDKNNTTIVTRA
jgi:hypothetical protein